LKRTIEKFVITLTFKEHMKKHNIIILALYIIAVSTFLSACNSANKQTGDTTDSVEITHKLGKTPIKKLPTRIVTLDIGALETLTALGVTPVGVPKKYMPEYLDGLKNNADVADVGSVIEPDFEAINAVSPDLILMSTRQERFYEELSHIAPTIFIGTDNKNYLPSFKENTMLLASIVNKEDEANEKLQALEAKIKSAQERFEQDSSKALFLIYNNGKFSAFGQGSRFGFIHDVLHIKPVMELQDESVHGQKVSNELIAEANPDYLFIVDRNAAVVGKKANLSEVENPLVKQTNAYKNQKIFYLDPNLWFISGGGLTSVDLMVDDIVKKLEAK